MMSRYLIFSFPPSMDLPLDQASLVDNPIIYFQSNFDFFKVMDNTLSLYIISSKEVLVGSRTILYFDLILDVQFLSLKWKAIEIHTLGTYVIPLTIIKLVPILVRPNAVCTVLAYLIQALVILVLVSVLISPVLIISLLAIVFVPPIPLTS